MVRARKEVIAAAGACNHQQYLTVRYRRHEIVASFWHHINNPYVGENLQDHTVCSIGFEAKDHLSETRPKSDRSGHGRISHDQNEPPHIC